MDLMEMTIRGQLGAGANTAAGSGNIAPPMAGILSLLTKGEISPRSTDKAATLGIFNDREGFAGKMIPTVIGGRQPNFLERILAAAHADIAKAAQDIRIAATEIGAPDDTHAGRIHAMGGGRGM